MYSIDRLTMDGVYTFGVSHTKTIHTITITTALRATGNMKNNIIDRLHHLLLAFLYFRTLGVMYHTRDKTQHHRKNESRKQKKNYMHTQYTMMMEKRTQKKSMYSPFSCLAIHVHRTECGVQCKRFSMGWSHHVEYEL